MGRAGWLYFAYGSNMPSRRIEARLGRCQVVSVGILPRFELRFHKQGRDGSGKCDAYWTGHREHRIHGVVYSIDDDQRRTLDRIEGSGYEHRAVAVHATTETFEAYTYVARTAAIASAALPFTWYKALVTEGAVEHGLPRDYVARLVSTPARVDPDWARSERHLEMARATRRHGAAIEGLELG